MYSMIDHYTEYTLIKNHYGDRVAERSKVPLMNHIHEGAYILEKIGASHTAIRAFCLHPLVQSDEALAKFYEDDDSYYTHRCALTLALEYRNIANQYLSHRKINDISEIALSPLKGVNQMLIADKIQNYKDFLLYHKDTHPRAKELDEYFNNWLKKLNINDFDYWFQILQNA